MDVEQLLNDLMDVREWGLSQATARLDELGALKVALARHRPDQDEASRKHYLKEFLGAAADRRDDFTAQSIRVAQDLNGEGGNSADRRERYALRYERSAQTVRKNGTERRDFTELAKAVLSLPAGDQSSSGDRSGDTRARQPMFGAPSGAAARAPLRLSLDSAVVEAAKSVGMPPDLAVVADRVSTVRPANFLSGASMNPLEVARFAVARHVDVDARVLALDEVADRLCGDASVGYLVAGAGEGKSTYLHALSASLMPRAIVIRWGVTGQLDWSKVQALRDEVNAIGTAGDLDELPVVIVGELATKLSRAEEDRLVNTLQSIPSGLAPSRTSLVLAGRPAWLNRIRQRISTGRTMRLLPLSSQEAGALIENLEEAYAACCHESGAAWTDAHFPNLRQFLSLSDASRVKVFEQGRSLVGSLLHAAYGAAFVNRLTSEYADLEPSDQAAYLLVSLATSAVGGISEDLLAAICPDANIERRCDGSPWQRNVDGLHTARHEMIGKLVVEDTQASTLRDISRMISSLLEAGPDSSEARDIFLSSVRIFDEPRSLVPPQRRKTEPQFRRAVRNGILANRTAWERIETSIEPDPGELLAYSYVLHRLLPGKLGHSEANEYVLTRNDGLLGRAEAATTPGSAMADRARYHRIFVEREVRQVRGETVDDLNDTRALLPMIRQSWPEPIFYAHFLSLGISTLRHCDLDDEESDQIAGAVLEAWQRLRAEGDTSEQIYEYSAFVARDLYDWPGSRRFSLWETAWEFSRALGNPDGSLACLLDDELSKLGGDDAAALRVRRSHILAESVVPGQTNAEVVLRFAELVGSEDETVRRMVPRVAGPLAAAEDPTTRSMALHSLAIVVASDSERLDYLRAALSAYELSMISRDDWLTRGAFWKRALRTLRGLDPNEASDLERRMSAVARKFRV